MNLRGAIADSGLLGRLARSASHWRRASHRACIRGARSGLAPSVSLPALLGAMLLALPARAENTMIDSELAVGSGVEGGDVGTAETAWRLARVRLTAGAEIRYDEAVHEGLGIRGFSELEGRVTLGAEVQFRHWVSNWFGVHAGITGLIAPQTLVGPSVGARLVFPFGKRVGLFVEPSFAALPIGSDLPPGSVLIWGLLSGGVRVSL
jgi:hypothetical protein